MTLVATPSLVRAKLGELLRHDAELLRHDAELRVVALQADPVWRHDPSLDLPAGRRAVVRSCVSTLAVRDALSALGEVPDRDVLVLL
ncbi:MAG TPA: hypothetical protein VKP64_09450, partial [Mycobacteriales bacterium]|nr:hypothetical protein [Mycobacteriales bacterium]